MERRMDRRYRERSRVQHPIDLESRSPMAWQHRDFNYQQHSTFHDRYPEGVASSSSDRFSHPSVGSRSARSATRERTSTANGRSAHRSSLTSQTSHRTPTSMNAQQQQQQQQRQGRGAGGASGAASAGGFHSSDRTTQPSSEETTTGSSSDGAETDSHAERGPVSRPGTSGTLRSMQSMPLLSPLHAPYNPTLVPGGVYGLGLVAAGAVLPPPAATWNGEPCPVHHQQPQQQQQQQIHQLQQQHHHHLQQQHQQQLQQQHAIPISMTPYPAFHPPMYSSMSMRRAASVHELAMATPLPALMPPPTAMGIYGTLPPPNAQPTEFYLPHPQLHHGAPAGVEAHGGAVLMMAGPPSLMAAPLPPALPPPPAHHPHRLSLRPPHRVSSSHHSLPPMPPASLLPPMQHRRPLVLNEKSGHAEPLPVREAPPLPAKLAPSEPSRTPSKSTAGGVGVDRRVAKPFSYDACCRGNVVVLWVILTIIALGVVIGVVFYFAFQ